MTPGSLPEASAMMLAVVLRSLRPATRIKVLTRASSCLPDSTRILPAAAVSCLPDSTINRAPISLSSRAAPFNTPAATTASSFATSFRVLAIASASVSAASFTARAAAPASRFSRAIMISPAPSPESRAIVRRVRPAASGFASTTCLKASVAWRRFAENDALNTFATSLICSSVAVSLISSNISVTGTGVTVGGSPSIGVVGTNGVAIGVSASRDGATGINRSTKLTPAISKVGLVGPLSGKKSFGLTGFRSVAAIPSTEKKMS